MPHAAAAGDPSAGEIRATFNRVHAQVLRELGVLEEHELDQPASTAHPLATTKLESLLWCANHAWRLHQFDPGQQTH